MQENKLSAVCEKVFDRCLAPTAGGEGCDNMTMILIQFKNISKPDASVIDKPLSSAPQSNSDESSAQASITDKSSAQASNVDKSSNQPCNADKTFDQPPKAEKGSNDEQLAEAAAKTAAEPSKAD